jgi:hypothetical protein
MFGSAGGRLRSSQRPARLTRRGGSGAWLAAVFATAARSGNRSGSRQNQGLGAAQSDFSTKLSTQNVDSSEIGFKTISSAI